jgi:membrane associated rhomboid family serine protease
MFLVPINRDRRSPQTPWVTYGLIAINSLLWIVPAFLGINQRLIFTYGYRPAAPSLLTLFASMFLHIGLLHVAGNMWFLWMFAPKLEARLGSFLFLFMYLLSGVGGAGLHTLLSSSSMLPCVGASGAISGIVGMYFVLYPRSPFELVFYFGFWLRKSFASQTRGAVGAWLAVQLLLGLISKAAGVNGGVAFWAHVGGFLTGVLCAGAELLTANADEVRSVIRPAPLTAEEKEEMLADTVEKSSGLTTLKLN